MERDSSAQRAAKNPNGERIARGTVHGFSVLSSIEFRYARDGAGEPLVVEEIDETVDVPSVDPLMEWMPRKWNPRHTRVFARDGSFTIVSDETPTFRVDTHEPSIAVKAPFDWLSGEAGLWGLPTALCFMERGDLAIHGASVDVHGAGILLAAPGGHGKTTLAAGFLRSGYRVLAEDTVCTRPVDPPAVIPGPACLRLRRDTYQNLKLRDTSIVAELPDRVHLALNGSARGSGDPVPLRAIVFLRKSEHGVKMERAASTDCLRDLWGLTLTLPRDAERKRSFAGVTTLTNAVPAWNLERPLRWDNLNEIVERVIQTCLGPDG